MHLLHCACPCIIIFPLSSYPDSNAYSPIPVQHTPPFDSPSTLLYLMLTIFYRVFISYPKVCVYTSVKCFISEVSIVQLLYHKVREQHSNTAVSIFTEPDITVSFTIKCLRTLQPCNPVFYPSQYTCLFFFTLTKPSCLRVIEGSYIL